MKVAWGENWVFYFGESDRLIGRTAKKIVDSRFHARRTRRRTKQLDGQIVSDRQAPDVKTGQTNFQVTWSVCARVYEGDFPKTICSSRRRRTQGGFCRHMGMELAKKKAMNYGKFPGKSTWWKERMLRRKERRKMKDQIVV